MQGEKGSEEGCSKKLVRHGWNVDMLKGMGGGWEGGYLYTCMEK